jgi:hypothetical protein
MRLGLGLGLQYSKLSGGGFDTDYQAVLDFATSEGDTLPSSSQQVIGNALVVQLKNIGVWNKLDSFAMFATDGDDGFSLIDWKRLAKMTIEGSPVRTINEGWKGNSTNGTINAGYKLQDLTQFDPVNSIGSFGGWAFDTKISGPDSLCGDDGNTNTIRGGGVDSIQGTNTGTSSLVTGLYVMNVDGTNSKQFINGVEIASTSSVGTKESLFNFHGLSEGGIDNFSLDKIAILFAGGNLLTEQLDFYNALETYMDAIAS